MIARILPAEQWDRLIGTELEAVYPHLNAQTAQVIVVEDEAGTIIGCWAGFPLWHCEGVWTDPTHRGKAGVARLLLETMRRVAIENGFRSIVTASADYTVDRLLKHLKATKIPGTHYVLPVTPQET